MSGVRYDAVVDVDDEVSWDVVARQPFDLYSLTQAIRMFPGRPRAHGPAGRPRVSHVDIHRAIGRPEGYKFGPPSPDPVLLGRAAW